MHVNIVVGSTDLALNKVGYTRYRYLMFSQVRVRSFRTQYFKSLQGANFLFGRTPPLAPFKYVDSKSSSSKELHQSIVILGSQVPTFNDRTLCVKPVNY